LAKYRAAARASARCRPSESIDRIGRCEHRTNEIGTDKLNAFGVPCSALALPADYTKSGAAPNAAIQPTVGGNVRRQRTATLSLNVAATSAYTRRCRTPIEFGTMTLG
jgi:hypothetical protein